MGILSRSLRASGFTSTYFFLKEYFDIYNEARTRLQQSRRRDEVSDKQGANGMEKGRNLPGEEKEKGED